MGIFDKLFGGKKETVAVEAPPCPHATLVARWDNVDDMGYEEKATNFFCEACHEEFTPAEAQALRSGVTDRLLYQDAASNE